MTASAYHAAPAKKPSSRHPFSYRDKVEGRLHAAQINGGASAATPRGDDRYTVVGRAGDRYTVLAVDLETMRCDCKADQYGAPCWHAASVYLRIVAGRATMLVTA